MFNRPPAHGNPDCPRAYGRTKLLDAAAPCDLTVEIIRRSDDISGFKVLPRHWVVERTFGWVTRWRRLVRDYERRLDVSEAMAHLAAGSNLFWLLAHREG